jgi:chromosome partitioning protein
MPLQGPSLIKSVDVRSLLQVAPPTLSELYKKMEIRHVDSEKQPKRGAAKHIYASDARRIFEARGFQYPSKATVLSFMMCKGGVGKTTSTLFLAQRMAAYGARVLAIDGDPQGNLTSAFDLERQGFEVDANTPILIDVITNECSMQEAIVELTPTLHVLPSTPVNSNLEGRIREHFKNPSLPILKRVTKPVAKSYDYILIDCAPALNLTNSSIIYASGTVVLPVAPDKFSQLGLEQTLNEIKQIENDFETSIKTRIVFTKFDGREFTSLKYLSDIATKYEAHLRYDTAIRTCADVKNVITRHEDLFALRRSNAREDYDGLAREIMGLTTLVKETSRSVRRAG